MLVAGQSKSRGGGGGRYARCGANCVAGVASCAAGVASGRRQRSVRRPEAEDSRRVWFRGYRA